MHHIILLAQNGTTHHLSVHPSEKSPAVPSVYLPLLYTHIRDEREGGNIYACISIYFATALKSIQF